ncbi:MAG: NAD(P)H-dependent glycerol-3-phosphate dehydrogenase [Clostridia bacterium]|nr:NAD(P)H-dependent glycerol-3-phosphate dehydrogenase [Clostridia bacterium]
MNITVIGCGRWGSLIAWYLDTLGHTITLYGLKGADTMERFLKERKNDLLTLPDSIALSTDIAVAQTADILIISVPSQNLRDVFRDLEPLALRHKTVVLCMKGLEIATGKRLSQVATEFLHPTCNVAVWLGPGHVQDFYAGIPNCMVIDSADEATKERLITAFSGPLIRFYYGDDLLGNEIGGAAKNVVGIAAGILDGLHLSTLKGALMSRGTREIARLIEALGGKPQSAYGLCHLGDYEATLFSPYSQNRRFGECLITGESYAKLAEGYYTVKALHDMAAKTGVELPICEAVYNVLYMDADPKTAIGQLFERELKKE